jgi:hypothetical protein
LIRIEDHTILQETSKVAGLTSRLSLGVLCLIVLFSLYSNLRIINKEGDRLRFHPQQRLEEETEDQRVGKLRGLLPQANVMGYFSDQRPDKYDIYLAEYALCPLILVRTSKTAAKRPFVLVDCGQSTEGACFSDADYALFETFDHGLKLYRLKQK